MSVARLAVLAPGVGDFSIVYLGDLFLGLFGLDPTGAAFATVIAVVVEFVLGGLAGILIGWCGHRLRLRTSAAACALALALLGLQWLESIPIALP